MKQDYELHRSVKIWFYRTHTVKQLGASHFIISRDEVQMRAAFKTFDFVQDTVPGNSDVNPYLSILKTNGIYINVGMPAKSLGVSSFTLKTGNKLIAGSGAGG